jgi:4-amino-4-deoxy-L-arabinose transferase-like glycosyltransferase
MRPSVPPGSHAGANSGVHTTAKVAGRTPPASALNLTVAPAAADAPPVGARLQAAGPLPTLALPDATPLPGAASQSHRVRRRPAQGAVGRPGRHGLATSAWPLIAVLVVQASLSLRLVWSNTAFQDEALYLRAGHLEWAHWLHHDPIPNFPAYFSGAPVIYPPIGAVMDSAGGLAAARLLSLCFMLGVTSLVWATAARLYGRRAALLAAGLFATLAGTQFLGAFATYDALALLLLGLAVWLAVRGADCRSRTRIVLLITAGASLAAADAVKYATVLFTPVVLVVVGMAVWRRHDRVAGLVASAAVLLSWLTLLIAAIAAGGRDYWLGITTSTLARAESNVPVTAILQRAYVWTSLIMVLAVLGAVLAGRSEARGKLLPSVLVVAGVLVPVEQARLHTTVSLQKHVVFGAWFAAIAAGYGMARLSRVDPGHGWAAVMALPIAASTVFGSMGQAASLCAVWPNSTHVIAALRAEIRSHPGNYLAEDYDVEAYYLRGVVPWQHWSGTFYFSYPGARPGAASYQAAISSHYFSLVILGFGDTAATDRQITADMRQAGGYHVVARAGRFTIWATQERALPSQSGRNRAGY